MLGGEVLDAADVDGVHRSVHQSLERLDGLYLRVLGRLVDIATRVEVAVAWRC